MNRILSSLNSRPEGGAQDMPHCRVHRHKAERVPAFRFSGQSIDWRTLHGVDFDSLASSCDIDSWQRCLEAGLLDGNLSAEPAGKLTLNNVLQFSKLAQFGLQLLYHSLQDSGDAASLEAENRKLRADAVADAKVVARVRKEQERLTARQAKIVAENKRVLADNERANQLIERLWDALDRPPPVPQPVPQPEQAQQPHTEPGQSTLQESLARNQDSLRRHAERDAELVQHIRELQATINAGQHAATIRAEQEAHVQHQAQMREREARICKLEEQLTCIRNAKQHAEQDRAQQQRDADAACRAEEEAARALSKRIAHLESKCRSHQQEIDRLMTNGTSCVRDQHTQQIQRMASDKTQLEADLRAALQQAQEAMETARSDRQSFQEQQRHLQRQLADANAECKDWEDRALHAEKRLHDIEQEHGRTLQDLQQQLADAHKELHKKMQQLQELEAEMQDMESDLEEYKRVISQLESVQQTMEHARKDFKQFGGYLDKLQHAQRDVTDATFKLRALSRPPSAQAGGHHWKHRR